MGLTGVGRSPNMLAGVHTLCFIPSYRREHLPCGFQKPQRVKECRVLVPVQVHAFPDPEITASVDRCHWLLRGGVMAWGA